MSSCGHTSEWSFEAIEAVVSVDGELADVKIPPRHPLLDGRQRLVRGELVEQDGGEAADRTRPSRARRRPDHRGRVTVIRRPVPSAAAPAVLRFDADIPDVPADPAGIPWSTLVPSVFGGAVIALLFSPLFAVLAGVSAIGVIGRSLGSRYAHRKKTAKRGAAIAAVAAGIPQAQAEWSFGEIARRHGVHEGSSHLVQQGLKFGEAPWSRRLHPQDQLVVKLGIGGAFDVPVLDDETAVRIGPVSELGTLAARPVLLGSVPLEAEVASGRGLAMCGDREPVLDVVRSLLMHVVSEFGPADLAVVLVTTSDRLADWDWLKWAPSLAGVGVTVGEVEDVFDRLRAGEPINTVTGASEGRPLLVLVDGLEPSGPGALAQVFAGRTADVRFIWLGSSTEIPAACATRATVWPDQTLEVEDLLSPRRLGVDPGFRRGRSDVLTAEAACGLSRLLASFDDPELDDVGVTLPSRVSHEALYAGTHDVAGWERILRSRWARADRRKLTSTLGLDRSGPVVLDLVADGPHALAAGTTGSGKSEMLRSLIVGAALDQPPDQVSFVLVDFKGGGAFDLVADLPHVAAVVTDLDPAESSRALQSLQAEMKAREEQLRAAGCSDIAELARAESALTSGRSGDDDDDDRSDDRTMPRLVIVVDEFASLADELPEFLDGLIDVARRGRSLGVHLVLATQRPAGVVTGQIRANTNLRICLRVQDQSESQDVIEISDAARLPAIPGRAIISRGGVRPLTVQCVKVEADDSNRLTPFVLHPDLLERRLQGARGLEMEVEPSIRDLVEACRRVTPVRSAAPWLDPLTSVALGEVAAELGAAEQDNESLVVPLGWLDDPDRRALRPLGWTVGEGALAVVGSDGDDVEGTVRTAVAGLVSQGMRYVYVLDGSGGRLSDLEHLASVGSVVSVREPERCAKTLEYVRRLMVQVGGPGGLEGVGLVVHRWGAVVDALESEGGPGASTGLQRLLRDGVDQGLGVVLTAANDREIPGRVMANVGQRLVHRLADPAGYLSLGLRVGGGGTSIVLDGERCIDPASGLYGLVGRVADGEIVECDRVLRSPAQTVQVLGDTVGRTELVAVPSTQLVAPIGLNQELEQVELTLTQTRPVVVLGRSGSGRSTAIATIVEMLGRDRSDRVVVLDEAERLTADEARRVLDQAKADGRAVLIGATPAMGRGIGSWLAPLLVDAAIVLLNPSRSDGEVCRTIVPDLVDSSPGRAVLLDAGRSTIVQIAA